MRTGDGWKALGLDDVEARCVAEDPSLRPALEGDPDLSPLLEDLA